MIEQAFLINEIQILVATVALGMGFDKPDISFVIHFQRPVSVIAYYQQVWRDGRAVDRAYGILLSGMEDDEIHDCFIETAFPNQHAMLEILDAFVDASFILITRNWSPSPFPTWITAIPSHRHPTLVSDFAIRLASKLNIPLLPALIRTGVPPE